MAARAHAQAASPFPEIPLTIQEPPSYGWAYAAMASGALLVGGSFLLSSLADNTYQEYLAATQPDLIEELYDRTVLYDRLAGASLVTGEALLITGVYLRFARQPRGARLTFALEPGRCSLAYRF